MKTLILGSEGQLGRELLRIFPGAVQAGHSGEFGIDITNEQKISEFIEVHTPDLIINASAMTNVDKCEDDKNLALQTNGYAVKNIVKNAKMFGSYFVQISTDYVFDGKVGKYKEDSVPNPVNFYGLSKLIGDTFAQCYSGSLIVRTSGVFGHANNFPRFAYNTLRGGKTLNVIDGHYSPIHARSLAKSIGELVKLRTIGIINVSGERISRRELALKLCEMYRFDTSLIEVDVGKLAFKAKRPSDSSLDISMAKKIIPFDFYSSELNLKLLSE